MRKFGACEVARPSVADTKFENFVVALVQSCEAVPGKAGKGGWVRVIQVTGGVGMPSNRKWVIGSNFG